MATTEPEQPLNEFSRDGLREAQGAERAQRQQQSRDDIADLQRRLRESQEREQAAIDAAGQALGRAQVQFTEMEQLARAAGEAPVDPRIANPDDVPDAVRRVQAEIARNPPRRGRRGLPPGQNQGRRLPPGQSQSRRLPPGQSQAVETARQQRPGAERAQRQQQSRDDIADLQRRLRESQEREQAAIDAAGQALGRAQVQFTEMEQLARAAGEAPVDPRIANPDDVPDAVRRVQAEIARNPPRRGRRGLPPGQSQSRRLPPDQSQALDAARQQRPGAGILPPRQRTVDRLSPQQRRADNTELLRQVQGEAPRSGRQDPLPSVGACRASVVNNRVRVVCE